MSAKITTPPTTTGGGIDTDAEREAFRDAIQAVSIDEAYALRGLKNQMALMGTLSTADNPISIVKIGDSFGGQLPNLKEFANVRGSFRCEGITGTPNVSVTVHNDTGGNARDYNLAPDGFYYEIASTGILYAAHLATGVQGPADRIYYTLFPGTGTAILEFSINGGSWTAATGGSFDTSNTGVVPANSAKVGFVAIQSGYSTQVRTRMRASGGIVNGWIGQGCSGPGVTFIDFSLTGQDIGQSAGIREAVWKAMIAGYGSASGKKVDVVLSVFADHRFVSAQGGTNAWAIGSDAYADSGPMDTLRTWSRTSNSAIDWLIIGPHRVDPATDDGVNAPVDAAFLAVGIGQKVDARIAYTIPYIRDWALRKGEGFYNCYPLYPSFAIGDANGYYTDDIHLNTAGNYQKFNAVLAGTNLGALFEWRAPVTRFTGEIRFPSPGSTDGYTRMYSSGANTTVIGDSVNNHLSIAPSRIAPASDATASMGDYNLRYNGIHTQGVQTGFAEKTGAYTLTGYDHVILCTGSGGFTLTLPATFPGNYVAPAGREYVIINKTSGDVTLAASSDGSTLQKIDTATTLVVSTGTTKKVVSVGILASGNYDNWVTE